MALRKLVTLLCLLWISSFAIIVRVPDFDRKNGVKELFIHDHGDKVECTVVFWNEDHPNKLTDLIYDLYRLYKWGRFYDIETFYVYPDKIHFPDDFCDSSSYFQLENLHSAAEITLERFEFFNDEPVVYVSTWNHMFSNRPIPNVSYLSYSFEKASAGTRLDAEKKYSWKHNWRLQTTLLLCLVFLISMFFTIYLKSRAKSCVFFKALTTTCVAFIAVLNVEGAQWFIFFGLIFSLLGDIFLEFDRFFLYGMLAFSTTHVLYSVAFVFLYGAPAWWIFLMVYAVVLFQYIFLKRYLNGMKVPVLLYSLLIATMLSFSFAVTKHEIYYARILLPLGAALFAFSDSYLAWDKFARRLPLRNFLVLFTYFLGQLFIALSTVP